MFQKPHADPLLEEIITNLVSEMAGHDANSPEYAACVKQLGVLYKIRAENQPDRVKRDTIVLAATNLVGIAMIIHHEHVNVVTSKALGFVLKAR